MPPSSMAFPLSPDPAFCALSSLATAASLHGGEEGLVFDASVVREAQDLRAPCSRREMETVCEECGDVGAKHLLLRCSKCKSAARHRYCLDAIIFDSVVEWLCSDCIPKHNEAIESLEGATNQRQLRNIQFGSIIKAPNPDKEKVTIAWGLRAHRKRKNHVDASTIHSSSQDTSIRGRNRHIKERGDAITTQSCSGDSCAIFGGDILNRDDCEKDGEDRNRDLICTVESFDGSSNLALDHALEVEPNNLQKAMCVFELSSNSAECPDLPDVRSGCFVSSNYVEGLAPRGRKGDIVSPINDIKGSLPMIEDKSHPTAASVEQVDIASVNGEKSEPFKAVKGLEKSVVASTFAPNRSKLIQGSHLKTGSADVLKPLKQRLDSCSMVPIQSSPSNELEDRTVQENNAERTMCLADEETVTPVLKNHISNPSMANEHLVSNEGNSAEANMRSDEETVTPVLKTGSADVLKPLKQRLDSCSRVPIQSSPSNELEDRTVQENNAEGTMCLADEETVTPVLKNHISNPSMANEHLVSNEGNPAEANMRSDEETVTPVLNTGSADVLKPLKQRLDSCSRVPIQSSPSNELEDRTVQENNSEGTMCLADEETVTPVLKSHISNPSMANEHLVSNEGNSAEANMRSDEILLSTINNKMQRRKSVDGEIVNSCKVNGISDPDSAPGDLDASITGMTSYLGPKKRILKRVLEEEGINSKLLPSKFVGPCESTKTNPRKREQSESYTPDGIKYQKASIINQKKNVNATTSGSSASRLELRRRSLPCEMGSPSAPPRSSRLPPAGRFRKENGGVVVSRTSQGLTLSAAAAPAGVNSGLLPLSSASPAPATSSLGRGGNPARSCTPASPAVLQQAAARSKSRRPAPVASLRGCQNMPRKDNGSSDKVIGHSKKEKDKKMDKSWLARKASEGSPKTASDLQPSSLRRSSVDKSIPYSENMDLTPKESSCPVNNPGGSCAAQVAEISLTTKKLCDDNEPKKRRRPTLPSCDDDGYVRRQERKCVEKALKNPRRYVEDEEALRSGNLNQQCSNYYKKVEKQRNLNAGCAENNVSQLALQTGVTEDRSDILRTPLIPESTGVKPLEKAYWTGIMEIDKNYIPLSAHLSIKACKKVKELSRSLPPIMKVTKLSTWKPCPKHLEAPIPSADSIDLYFFCGDARPNKELDQLVKHVADSGIILEAIVGLAKLCLFPSSVLPEEYQSFQGKPYLWGLFSPRKDEIQRLAPVEQDCMAHVTEEEHVQEQHVLDQQDKAHADTQDQVVDCEKQPLLGASREVRIETLTDNVMPLIDMKALVFANTSPADHGQPYSNPEARPVKLCGFVVSRTPRSAQLIQEMQKEGALLFDVQQVVIEPGSLV